MKTTGRGGYYYTNALFFSVAYQELSIGSRNLLNMMIGELRYTHAKSKDGSHKVWTNNGEVSVTETEYRKFTQACSSTYIKSRNQLIEVGFIKQTHRGGTHRGDRAKYKVFISANGVANKDERWRDYPKKDWRHQVPTARKNLVGKQTQWKKGESGRKS